MLYLYNSILIFYFILIKTLNNKMAKVSITIIIPPNIENKIEEDSNLQDLEKANNYKGQYYNDKTEKNYYECGAHFSYSELNLKLAELHLKLSPARICPSTSVGSENKQEKAIEDKTPIKNDNHKIFHTLTIRIPDREEDDILLATVRKMNTSRNLHEVQGKKKIKLKFFN